MSSVNLPVIEPMTILFHVEHRDKFDALYRQSQTDAFEKLLLLKSPRSPKATRRLAAQRTAGSGSLRNVRLTHSAELDDFLKEYPAEIVDKMSERVWLMICVDHVAQLSDVPAIKAAHKVYRTKACAEHAASRR